jgi:hypothetical protein
MSPIFGLYLLRNLLKIPKFVISGIENEKAYADRMLLYHSVSVVDKRTLLGVGCAMGSVEMGCHE